MQHYPKLKKYISLFPPELRSEPHAHPDPYPHTYFRSEEPATESNTEKDTDAQREEVRAWVRERMADEQMSAEPEVELHTRENKPQDTPSREQQSVARFGPTKDSVPAMPQILKGDGFFEGGDGSEDGDGDVGDGNEEKGHD